MKENFKSKNNKNILEHFCRKETSFKETALLGNLYII